MKKIFVAIMLLVGANVFAQPLLDWSPGFLNETQAGNITITCNAAKGNGAFVGYTPATDVYVHIGVITNLSVSKNDWKYVLTAWATTPAAFNAPSTGTNQWTFTLPGNLRTYFGITNTAEHIQKIAILFRNGTGTIVQRNSDASDMYIPVEPAGALQMRFNQPPTEPRFEPWPEPISTAIGQTLPVEVVTSEPADITINLNGVQVGNGTNVTAQTALPTINQSCNNRLTATVNNTASTVNDTLDFFVVNNSSVITAALPAGIQDGINYGAGDTSVTLVLYAPNKTNVVATGSYNNWAMTCNELMKRTPDGLRYWTTINGLTPGQLYKFQYIVDGTITTTDPYTELVLDPFNDAYITSATYPNMPTYPQGRTGMVGTFTPGEPAYNWTANSYTRPDKKGLVVYELLLRDFVKEHNWLTLIDSLNYLDSLGVNCIELMPINEFEGNESWGYNPDFFFAPDKYYGPKNDLKKFIDEAHKRGIAVVIDAVMNQVTGLSPLAALYWNSTTNKPLASNPWLNVDATHPFNVFNDFNHESPLTKHHVHRYMRHWLKEYKIDGFRWDLAKGFTQVNYGNNVGAWSGYDASRVAIWKAYYDTMMNIEPNSYCILEFLGADAEESEYANYGMLLWGKQTAEYAENNMGQNGNKSIDRAYHKNRPGYNAPGLIAYAESHDEERAMYSTKLYGNAVAGYNVKSLPIGLARSQAMHAFLLMIPGPKMLWQFEELGYDYSINTCQDSVTIDPNCRLSNKPIRWDYYQQPDRKNLYNAIAKMNKLRKRKPSLFNDAYIVSGTDLGNSLIKKLVVVNGTQKVVVIANFDVVNQTFNTIFPSNGKWWNYMGTDSVSVSGGFKSITLAPGEYKIYTDSNLNAVKGPNAIENINVGLNNAFIFPNPASTETTNLVLDFSTNTELNVEVLDISGKVVQQIFNGAANSGVSTYEIPTYTLANGYYMVQIKSNLGSKMLRLSVQK
jgi:1,4-alpha-glucan branching enzyme